GHPWATVRESQWKYTEIPVTPGDPNTAFERELYDLIADPYELTNVASDPQHAARIATMAVQLRQLRQFWPVDSNPNGPDPEEDEGGRLSAVAPEDPARVRVADEPGGPPRDEPGSVTALELPAVDADAVDADAGSAAHVHARVADGARPIAVRLHHRGADL